MGRQIRRSHSRDQGAGLKFIATPLEGLFVLENESVGDQRGFFARTFCVHEFAARGLDTTIAQCNLSFNEKSGTLRGLHYQMEPYAEAKLVRCISGAIYDVAVDLRSGSATYLKWFSVELSATNRLALFIPRGFAHGFQTLVDHSEIFYMMSEFYHPDSGRGVRWNDPALAIDWPLPNPIMSEKDRLYPLLRGPRE